MVRTKKRLEQIYLLQLLTEITLSRKGKLAACIPKMLQLLDTNEMITFAHAWTECSTSVYPYRTQEEFMDLTRGVFVDDPFDYYRTNDLNPGTLFRLDYYIGLNLSPSAIDRKFLSFSHLRLV